MKQKILGLVAFAIIGLSVFNAEAKIAYNDMPDDYSTEALENAVENRLLSGYNYHIFPDKGLTRAEMATILVRAFGATETATISKYKDVKKDAWYYDDMAIAVKMGIFTGDGTLMYPDNFITREEAMVVLSRAFGIVTDNTSNLNNYTDSNLVSSWAEESVSAMISSGYITGHNQKINPKSYISRKDFAVIMDRMVEVYESDDGTFDADVTGSLMLRADDVYLKNNTISGNVIIGDGALDGDISITNTSIKGDLIVRAGGVETITIGRGTTIDDIIITKPDGDVRIFMENGVSVNDVFILSGEEDVIIEGSEFDNLEIRSTTPVFLINTNVTTTDIYAREVELVTDIYTDINRVNIKETAEEVLVEALEDSDITAIYTYGIETTVEGDGRVESVRVFANDATISTAGTNVRVDDDIEGTKVGKYTVAEGDDQKADGSLPGDPLTEEELAQRKGVTTNVKTEVELLTALRGAVAGDTVKVNTDIVAYNDLNVNTGVSLEVNRSKQLTLANASNLVNNGYVEVYGELSVNHGKIENNNQLLNEGVLQVNSSRSITNTGSVTNEGELNISGTFSNQGFFENLEDGEVLVSYENSSFTNSKTIDNDGVIKVIGTFSNSSEVEVNETGMIIGEEVISKDPTGEGYWTGKEIENGFDLKAALLSAEITGDKVILENDITVEDDIIVPYGVELEIKSGVILTNNDKIEVFGTIMNYGEIKNNNTLESEEGGRITGVITGKTPKGNGYYTGKSIKTGHDLLWAIDAVGSAEATLELEATITFTDDVTVPKNITLVIPSKYKVTIGYQKILTVNGIIENNGVITVNAEGKIVVGTDGKILGNPVYGVQPTGSGEWPTALTEETLGMMTAGNTYALVEDVKISDTVTVPYGATLKLPDGNELDVLSGGKLIVAGEIYNQESIEIITGGEIEIADTGRIMGNIVKTKVDKDTGLNGITLAGSKKGFYSGKSIENSADLITSIESAKIATDTTAKKLQINTNITISDDFTIEENMTLEIAKEIHCVLDANVINLGKFEVDGSIEIKGQVLGNALSGNVTGEGYYPLKPITDFATLKIANESAQLANATKSKVLVVGSEGATIDNLDNIVISEDFYLEADIDMEIEETAKIIINENVTFTNNSDIKNYGIILIDEKGTLVNNVKITNYYVIDVEGTLNTNSGKIANSLEVLLKSTGRIYGDDNISGKNVIIK